MHACAGEREHRDAAAVRGDGQGVRAPRAVLGRGAAVPPGGAGHEGDDHHVSQVARVGHVPDRAVRPAALRQALPRRLRRLAQAPQGTRARTVLPSNRPPSFSPRLHLPQPFCSPGVTLLCAVFVCRASSRSVGPT